MELLRYLAPGNIVLDMKSRDRWDAIDELLSAAFPYAGPKYEKVLRSLRDAEGKKCSAVGRSVTIIHAITEDIPDLKIVLGRSKRGISWDAPDGRVINLFWLLIHPEREQDRYLKLLAQAVRVCRDDEKRRRLIQASTPEEVITTITGNIP